MSNFNASNIGNNHLTRRIGPEAISTARRLGYNERELQLAERTMNSLEIQHVAQHRGIYKFIDDHGHRSNDKNYTVNCELIHHWDKNGSVGYHDKQLELQQRYGLQDYPGAPPASAYFGQTDWFAQQSADPYAFQQQYLGGTPAFSSPANAARYANLPPEMQMMYNMLRG